MAEAAFSGSLLVQCEVRQGEVGFGLHFGEASGAAHEFVGKVAVGVELFGRHGEAGAEFDAVVVEYVDQPGEAACFGAFGFVELRDVRDENHATGFGQGEVVGLGAGAPAQGVEVEPQYAVGLALGGDFAAEQGQAAGL